MKTLLQLLHQLIYKKRILFFVLFSLLLISSVFSKGKEWKYGLECNLNFANQIAYNPLNMENESYDWNYLTTYALGDVVKYNGRVYLSLANANTGNLLPVSYLTTYGFHALMHYQPYKHWAFTGKFGYNKKGFIQPNPTYFRTTGDTTINPSVTSDISNKNKFHYLDLQVLANYYIGKKAVKPFINAGVAVNYLLSKNLGSAEWFDIKGNQYYDYNSYKKMALSLIGGVGILVNGKFYLGMSTAYDITKSVATSKLAVKNHLYSIQLGVTLQQLFKKY